MATLYTATTMDPPPGYTVEREIGMCWGLLVNSAGAVRGIAGGFKSLQAGEVPQFSATLDEARHHAVDRMMNHAAALGGNAVLGVRFGASKVGGNDSKDRNSTPAAEIVAYGTAVVLRAES